MKYVNLQRVGPESITLALNEEAASPFWSSLSHQHDLSPVLGLLASLGSQLPIRLVRHDSIHGRADSPVARWPVPARRPSFPIVKSNLLSLPSRCQLSLPRLLVVFIVRLEKFKGEDIRNLQLPLPLHLRPRSFASCLIQVVHRPRSPVLRGELRSTLARLGLLLEQRISLLALASLGSSLSIRVISFTHPTDCTIWQLTLQQPGRRLGHALLIVRQLDVKKPPLVERRRRSLPPPPQSGSPIQAQAGRAEQRCSPTNPLRAFPME